MEADTERVQPARGAPGEKRFVPKPEFVVRLERRIAFLVPFHPNTLSGFKFLVIIPLLVLALKQTGTIPAEPWVVSLMFALFALLDYLDGVVARNKNLESGFGRIFDRVTDYPMLFVLSLFCIDVLPAVLVITKLVLDFVLLLQFIVGQGSTENRLRTTISYTTLLALLFLSQGWGPKFVTAELVEYLLYTGIAFSSTVILYNAGFLKRRYLADTLSGLNLMCGVFSMIYAYRGRVDISIVFLMLGAAFDGFDGAAARKFGGTRWGVYSDDVADGVNYGIAPGAAIWFVLGGVEGLVVGALYSVFTISRLVFFTLNKADSDPNYFSGVPSTVGALVALSSLLLVRDQPVLLGLMVGVACVQMVSFDTHYRHLGKLLSLSRRYQFGATGLLIVLLATGFLFGMKVAAAVILAASLGYGFFPTVIHFRRLMRGYGSGSGSGGATQST